MDVQPSIFAAWSAPLSQMRGASASLGSQTAQVSIRPSEACESAHKPLRSQESADAEAAGVAAATELPHNTMAALGPSVETLLHAPSRAAESGCCPLQPPCELSTSCSSSMASFLPSMPSLESSGCSGATEDLSSQPPWQKHPPLHRACRAASSSSQPASSAQDSCIPAFHHSCSESRASAPGRVSSSAFEAPPRLRNAWSACIHIAPCAGAPDTDCARLEHTMCSWQESRGGGRAECSLLRVHSLIPRRRSMLTPASECLGTDMLEEVPALKTYKKERPMRPCQRGRSSVTFVDNPTVNVFQDGQDTACMTVSAAPVQPESMDVCSRKKHNRSRNSYQVLRTALTLRPTAPEAAADCEVTQQGNAAPHSDGCAASLASPTQSLLSGATDWPHGGTVPPLGAEASKATSLERLQDSVSVPVCSSRRESASAGSTTAPSDQCGRLVACIEVICQAVMDSKNLHVHTELGCKLSAPPTWMEVVTLLLASLAQPRGASDPPISESDICEVGSTHPMKLFWQLAAWCSCTLTRSIVGASGCPRL
jgi:hypothetical protein